MVFPSWMQHFDGDIWGYDSSDRRCLEQSVRQLRVLNQHIPRFVWVILKFEIDFRKILVSYHYNFFHFFHKRVHLFGGQCSYGL